MIINTNIDAMKTHRSLNVNNRKNDKSMEKLSSGLKINRAADDSAGLAISEKMRAQIRGLMQDDRNIDDGMSMFNVAEGGMEQIENMIHRIRELAVQSASDTNTDDDRQKIQGEVEQLIEGIDRIAKDTEFNTHKVLCGKLTTTSSTTFYSIFESKVDFSSQVINLKNTIGSNTNWLASPANSYFYINNVGGGARIQVPPSGVSVTGSSAAGYAPIDQYINDNFNAAGCPNGGTDFKTFLQNLTGTQAEAQFLADAIAGAFNNAMQYAPGGSGSFPPVTGVVTNGKIGFLIGDGTQYYITFGNCSPATTTNLGHGFLHDTSATGFGGGATTSTTTTTSETAEANEYIIHVGANTDQNILFKVPAMPAAVIGTQGPPPQTIKQADVTTQTKANDTIALCDIALAYVNDARALMGAHVNRLEHAKDNVLNYHLNISAAESRLRDTNMSKEMMEQVKDSILTQAATAMLAQANQKPEGILQLLR